MRAAIVLGEDFIYARLRVCWRCSHMVHETWHIISVDERVAFQKRSRTLLDHPGVNLREKGTGFSLSLSILPFSRPICNYREFFDTNDLSLPRNWFLRSSVRSFVCLCYSISHFFAIFFQFSSRDNYIRYYIRNCASILSYRWRDGEIRLMSSKSCRIFADRRFRRFDFKNFKKGESISFRAIVFKKREKIVSSRGHASAHFSFEYISFPRGEG